MLPGCYQESHLPPIDVEVASEEANIYVYTHTLKLRKTKDGIESLKPRERKQVPDREGINGNQGILHVSC